MKMGLTQIEFILKAKNIHGEKYDYSLSEYKGINKKIEIICLKHGSFWQTPCIHLRGSGCLICGNLESNKKQRFTIEDFIQKSNKTHQNIYDYSLVEYINNKSKIKIVCKKHGIFLQKPCDHFIGNGCPKCATLTSKPETEWLNILNIPKENRQYKIKINNKNYRVDGFEKQTNTCLEFLGCFYHGCLKCYKSENINKVNKKNFGELYQKTMERIQLFIENGYNVTYIWEHEFKNQLKESK